MAPRLPPKSTDLTSNHQWSPSAEMTSRASSGSNSDERRNAGTIKLKISLFGWGDFNE